MLSNPFVIMTAPPEKNYYAEEASPQINSVQKVQPLFDDSGVQLWQMLLLRETGRRKRFLDYGEDEEWAEGEARSSLLDSVLVDVQEVLGL
jgi:hypothetical protein